MLWVRRGCQAPPDQRTGAQKNEVVHLESLSQLVTELGLIFTQLTNELVVPSTLLDYLWGSKKSTVGPPDSRVLHSWIQPTMNEKQYF